MTKSRAAQLLTLAVLIGVVGIGVFRVKSLRRASPEQTPQDAVYAMLNAARSGEVKTYLSSFAGPLEAALRQARSETTETAFAKYLRDSNAEIKGVAVSDPEKITDIEIRVRVEYVYQDRNEQQTMYLRTGSSGWKIFRTDADERVKTLIPYGTPLR
jgi:hypothetical protein